MYIEFLEVGCKNFMSVGNTWMILKLNEHKKNLVIGKNGTGKCVDPSTEIEIEIEDINILKLFEKNLT